MLTDLSVAKFLDELASDSPAPGGGSVAGLAAASGSALTSMVCALTIGKKKYAAVEPEMKKILEQSETLREQFTQLVDDDTAAFNKVMEAFGLPKESAAQEALRKAAIEAATKEAALVPLSVMKHVVDALALARIVAEKGNVRSVSDAGVAALMLRAAAEGAALNVEINLGGISDSEFIGWHTEELVSLRRTTEVKAGEILEIVKGKLKG